MLCEHLICKYKVLNSNPSGKEGERRRERKREREREREREKASIDSVLQGTGLGFGRYIQEA
jgi:hypothetical protein